jgi:hypothetical protein
MKIWLGDIQKQRVDNRGGCVRCINCKKWTTKKFFLNTGGFCGKCYKILEEAKGILEPPTI